MIAWQKTMLRLTWLSPYFWWESHVQSPSKELHLPPRGGKKNRNIPHFFFYSAPSAKNQSSWLVLFIKKGIPSLNMAAVTPMVLTTISLCFFQNLLTLPPTATDRNIWHFYCSLSLVRVWPCNMVHLMISRSPLGKKCLGKTCLPLRKTGYL